MQVNNPQVARERAGQITRLQLVDTELSRPGVTFPMLRYLNISNCTGRVADWIAACPNLSQLTLTGTTGLLDLQANTSLDGIQLRASRLEAVVLPTALRSLHFADVQLKKRVRLLDLPHLQILSLRGMGLRDYPADLPQSAELRELDLSHNRLQALPAWLWRLPRLTRLQISDNRLTDIAPLPDGAALLQTLDLKNNRLKTFPGPLIHLPLLRALRLGGNQLKNIPKELRQNQWLARLDLGCNRLQEWPPVLGGLGRLEELVLSSNPLPPPAPGTSLPPNLRKIKWPAYAKPDAFACLLPLSKLVDVKGGRWAKPYLTLHRSLHKQVNDPEVRTAFFGLWKSQRRPEGWSRKWLLTGLRLAVPALRQACEEVLLSDRPLYANGARVWVTGKTPLAKADWQQRLNVLGLRMATAPDQADIIVVGKSPDYHPEWEVHRVVLVPPAALLLAWVSRNGYWNAERLSKCRRLLMHAQADFRQLACPLLRACGAPRELATVLLWTWQRESNPALKRQWRQSLELYLDTPSRHRLATGFPKKPTRQDLEAYCAGTFFKVDILTVLVTGAGDES